MARLYSKQDMGSPCQTPISTFIGAGITPFIIKEVLALLYIVFSRFMNSLGNLNSSRISQSCHRLSLGQDWLCSHFVLVFLHSLSPSGLVLYGQISFFLGQILLGLWGLGFSMLCWACLPLFGYGFCNLFLTGLLVCSFLFSFCLSFWRWGSLFL